MQRLHNIVSKIIKLWSLPPPPSPKNHPPKINIPMHHQQQKHNNFEKSFFMKSLYCHCAPMLHALPLWVLWKLHLLSPGWQNQRCCRYLFGHGWLSIKHQLTKLLTYQFGQCDTWHCFLLPVQLTVTVKNWIVNLLNKLWHFKTKSSTVSFYFDTSSTCFWVNKASLLHVLEKNMFWMTTSFQSFRNPIYYGFWSSGSVFDDQVVIIRHGCWKIQEKTPVFCCGINMYLFLCTHFLGELFDQ